MVTRILFGPPPELPRAARPLPSSELESWNGPVTLAPGVRVDSRVRDGAVWLTARDQEGMFRISGADSTARAQALMLSRQADWVVDSLLQGGAHSLDSTFSPSLVEAAHPEFFRFWRITADSLGGNPSSLVLGTVSSSPGAARTLVRLQGSRSSRILTLEWLGGHLIQSTTMPTEGYTQRFTPESRARLSRYDLWSMRTIGLSDSSRSLQRYTQQTRQRALAVQKDPEDPSYRSAREALGTNGSGDHARNPGHLNASRTVSLSCLTASMPVRTQEIHFADTLAAPSTLP
jgi:hypothetical protein